MFNVQRILWRRVTVGTLIRNEHNNNNNPSLSLTHTTTWRPFSLGPRLLLVEERRKGDELSEDVAQPRHTLTTGQKVKQAGKDVTYFGIMIFGFGITGSLLWYVVSELFFGFSSNAVYSKAFDIVKDNARVAIEVGDGMKGFGEDSGRGRRRNVGFQEYTVDGVNYMRVQFYIKGSHRQATVHCEAVDKGHGKFDFRYVFVEFTDFPITKPIIVVDNR